MHVQAALMLGSECHLLYCYYSTALVVDGHGPQLLFFMHAWILSLVNIIDMHLMLFGRCFALAVCLSC